MSTISNLGITSNTVQARYGSVWSSVYDFLKPQVWQNLVKYYGSGVGLADFAHVNGATIKVAGPTLTAYEEGSQFKLVELGADIVAVGEGVDATATLAAGEYDAQNKCYLRVNDVVIIPAYYLEQDGSKSIRPEEYQVTQIVGVGAAAQYTLHPHKDDVAIVANVPSGTKLMVTGGFYANESASGTPKASGWYTRTFTTSTIKEDGAIGGSTESNQRWTDDLNGGMKGVFSKQTAECDMRLMKTLSDQIWISGGVTNTFTMNNRDSEAIQVTGSVGLLQHLLNNAMLQYFTAAYDRTCFEDIKPALESQGVQNANLNFFYGSELGRQLENCGLDFIKEFSGGTDFMKTMGSIDSSFKSVKFNGVNVNFSGLSVLNDPTSYGADSFDDYFRSMGILIPDVEVSVKKDPNSSEYFSLKNFTLGYKSYGKEDRTRIFRWLPGVNGLGVAGDIAVDTYDDLRFTMLVEYMVIALKFNQCILVMDDRVLVSP